MRRFGTLIVLLALGAIVGSVAALPALTPNLAVLPHYQAFNGGTIYYQGRVTQTDGSPISDGSHNFTFTLHDHVTAPSPVWSEARTEITTDGLLAVTLGEIVPLTLDSLGTSGQDTARILYLEIDVDGETISPRTRLIPTPMAHLAERLLGDVETRPNNLLIVHPATGDSILSLGADGQAAETVHLYLKANGSAEAELEVNANSGHLVISNIGSSGEDGVDINVGESWVRIGSHHLNAVGDTTSVQLGWTSPDGSSGSLRSIDPATGDEARIVMNASSSSGGTLTVSNIGSSGEDGVFIVAAEGAVEVKLGIEHEDIGVRMHTADEGSGAGLTLTDSTGDSTIYAMNKAELVEVLATNTKTTRLDAEGLTISNIGSSGQDGISIQGGGGAGGRLFFRNLSSAQTIETEMIALSLVSSEPLLAMRARDAAPADPPILRFEYDANDRIVQRLTSTPGSDGDSAELHSSGLHFYDGFDRVRIDGANGGKISLRRLQSAQTIETEIVALSLVGSEPLISLRMPDALPTDPPLAEYSYDLLNRRIIETRRSEAGQPGDSSTQSSTELTFNDFSAGVEFGIGGLQFSDAAGPSFSVTPSGDMQLRQSAQLALIPGTSVEIGGTFPGPKLFVDGNICATGAIGPCSDVRYKKNIVTISHPLEKILKLRGVAFDWRQDEFSEMNFSDKRQVGLIAQEVKEVLPEVVEQGDNGYYFVDYSRLTPVLIEAVKEQQKTIESLNDKVSQAEKVTTQVQEMKVQIAQLLSLVEVLLADKSPKAEVDLAVNK